MGALHTSTAPRLSDADLIRSAAEGCPRAAQLLYQRHAPRVFSVLLRMVRCEETARDLAQETWLRAFRALGAFRADARFSTWIHRIAVNTALTELRQGRAKRDRETDLVESIPADDRKGDVLLAERLDAALAALPDGMRKILVLHDVEGFTHVQIGKLLGIAPGTSKSQLFRARARVREQLTGMVTAGPLEELEQFAAA